MGLVLLTTPKSVKNSSAIQDNVDDKLIAPYIQKAQFTHIHEMLGTDLYDKLLSDVKNDQLTATYKLLLDKYIVPCLNEWTVYEVMPFISLKLTNKSIVKGKSEYSDAGDLSDLKYLRSTVYDLASFYNQRLISYLKQHTDIYPEYITNATIDKLKPSHSRNMIGGIYVGDGGLEECTFGLDLPK
jgi:hypothetical protein